MSGVGIGPHPFPGLLGSMLAVILLAASGALSDPSVTMIRSALWSPIHPAAAWLFLAFLAWAFWRQSRTIKAVSQVVERIVGQVDRAKE
jgi:hypothetical protein